MKIRKILAAITSVALVGTMLAGCNNDNTSSGGDNSPAGNNGSTSNDNNGSTPAATENPEKDVKLKVWYPSEEKAMVEKLCEEFKAAHPDQNIEFTYGVVGGDAAKDEIIKDKDNAADVFFFSPDHTEAMVDAGVIAPVTRNKQTIIDRNLEESSKSVTVGDELYGYPVNSKTYILYYDKSKFTEDEVKSLDTMVSKDLGGDVQYNVCIPLKNTWYTPMLFFPMGCTLTGSDPVICDFNSEAGMKAANYMVDLFANSKFCPDKDEMENMYGQLFKEGKIGACVTGTWKAAEYQEALGENYAATILPKATIDGTEVQLGGFSQYNAMGVKAGSEFPITAADLADFLTNKESQKVRFDEISDSPTNKELAADSAALASNPAVAANAAQCSFTNLQAGSMGEYWTVMSGVLDNIGTTITKDNIKEKMDEAVSQITAGGLSS
ncbi:MAG: extracellular solute-binding protein [Ruminococcaceae bacterium]|nr:extracellular solute-binding protein [Oscillospiraceae bacterium]